MFVVINFGCREKRLGWRVRKEGECTANVQGAQTKVVLCSKRARRELTRIVAKQLVVIIVFWGFNRERGAAFCADAPLTA